MRSHRERTITLLKANGPQPEEITKPNNSIIITHNGNLERNEAHTNDHN